MELTLKSNNQESLAKIIALAKKLNIMIEQSETELGNAQKEVLKKNILNFQSKGDSSFGDAAQWEKDQRKERNLPLNK